VQTFIAALPMKETNVDRVDDLVRGAFATAVDQLTAQGVRAADAEKNLRLKDIAPSATIVGPVSSTNSLLQ